MKNSKWIMQNAVTISELITLVGIVWNIIGLVGLAVVAANLNEEHIIPIATSIWFTGTAILLLASILYEWSLGRALKHIQHSNRERCLED
jgi:hypothetical protein